MVFTKQVPFPCDLLFCNECFLCLAQWSYSNRSKTYIMYFLWLQDMSRLEIEKKFVTKDNVLS